MFLGLRLDCSHYLMSRWKQRYTHMWHRRSKHQFKHAFASKNTHAIYKPYHIHIPHNIWLGLDNHLFELGPHQLYLMWKHSRLYCSYECSSFFYLDDMTPETNNRETHMRRINHKYMEIVCFLDSLCLGLCWGPTQSFGPQIYNYPLEMRTDHIRPKIPCCP